MRPDTFVLALSFLTSTTASVIFPPQIVQRTDIAAAADEHDLFKRRGGGGGGSRGGSGGSSSGGSSSSGSSSSGSSSGSSKSGSSSSGGSSSSSSRTSSSSNSGGYSSSGSGPKRSYGGGSYYSGGAAVPYRAGAATAAGLVPFFLIGSALAFWPGVWLYGAYMYNYNPHRFYNASSRANETLDVICGCARFAVCGCEDNNSTSYYNDLIGNGSYAALNRSVVNVAKVNGTDTLLINGTLPNGTTAVGDDSAAGDSMRSMAQALGFWPVVVAVLATVFLA